MWECIVCDSGYLKRRERVRGRYCSVECLEKDMGRACEECGAFYVARLKKQELCTRCSQSNTIQSRRFYNKNIYKKKCANCRATFQGKKNRTLCLECYEKNRQETMVHTYDEKVVRNVHCKECGAIHKTEEATLSGATKTDVFRNLCNNCKQARRNYRKQKDECRYIAELTEIMWMGHLPFSELPRFVGAIGEESLYRRLRNARERIAFRNSPTRKYRAVREEEKQRNRQRESERMKRHNPMFREDVRKRVSETTKRKYANGEIPRVSGTKHHLWKGNRSFNLTCRSRLYSVWTFPVMERDGFICQECGIGGQLQAHHLRPMRDIIAKISKMVDIPRFDECDKTSEEYDSYVQMVVDEHKLEDGITYCKSCHAKLDDRYRVRKV